MLILSLIGGLIAGFALWKRGRVLQRIGASGAFPIILPLVGDFYKDDEEKTNSCLSVIETSNTFGKVLSPILGSIFGLLWYLPFFLISFFSLISIALLFFFIKVPKEQEEPKRLREFITTTKKIFKREGKWLFTVFLLGAFLMVVLFGLLFFLSDSLEKIHHLKG